MPAVGCVEQEVPARSEDAPDLEAKVEDGKRQFAGVELPHRTLGIVGLGAIGSLVADGSSRLVVVVSHVPEMQETIGDLIRLDRDPLTGDTRVIRA